MKHKAKALEINFGEPEAFALVIEKTNDGERIAKEKQQRETDRAESEKQQTQFI